MNHKELAEKLIALAEELLKEQDDTVDYGPTGISLVKDLRVWDNGGSSADRYTVVWPDGSYVAMDDRPLWPSGIYMHGDGAEYDPDVEIRGNVALSYLGKEIAFWDLPQECQSAIITLEFEV